MSHPTPDPSPVISTQRLFPFPPEKIFAAFQNPDQLARWWGPKDFTNTFHHFDFQPGGRWTFTMHSPNGTSYPNESIFREIQPHTKIVIDHIVHPHFRLTITLTPRDPHHTHLAWDQQFDSAETAAKFRPLSQSANEQNLDRLHTLLTTQSP